MATMKFKVLLKESELRTLKCIRVRAMTYARKNEPNALSYYLPKFPHWGEDRGGGSTIAEYFLPLPSPSPPFLGLRTVRV
jgi:hypothetical protein